MKKYVAAAAVAVMVFAFAAFAASLQVDAGVLQVGADSDLTCADNAVVYAYGYNDHTNPATIANLGLALTMDDEADSHTCAGESIMVTLLQADGTALEPHRSFKIAVDGEDQQRFEFADSPPVEDVHGVRVAVERGGPGVGTWDDSPLND